MPAKNHQNNNPKIIALEHPPFPNSLSKHTALAEGSAQIRAFLEKRAKKGTTFRIFLEGSLDMLNYFKKIDLDFAEMGSEEKDRSFFLADLSPYFNVVQIATREKWPIIPLDKKAIKALVEKGIAKKDSTLGRYLVSNLRERYWAHLLKIMKPTSVDVIIVHPNHVRGLLIETGMNPRNVIWFNRPRNFFARWRRLSKLEEKRFKRKRNAARKQSGSKPKPR
ncbi:MAG: hypothetical protein PHD95_00540 [Candidatus ainarchaeum sp.]|nr:hypothetical protein [Candidatus ainarchaeum sp.]